MSPQEQPAGRQASPDEPDLIRRARDGESEAFAELVRRHHAAVLGLCVSVLRDRAAADDAAQEVFIKAYESLDAFRGDAAFSTWLHRIAYNRCLDILRRENRRRAESWEALLEKEGDSIHRLLAAPSAPGPSDEDAELARRVLDQLEAGPRLILTLREVQGYTYRELAETLGCSIDAVKARLRRARRGLEEKLRHLLAPSDV